MDILDDIDAVSAHYFAQAMDGLRDALDGALSAEYETDCGPGEEEWLDSYATMQPVTAAAWRAPEKWEHGPEQLAPTATEVLAQRDQMAGLSAAGRRLGRRAARDDARTLIFSPEAAGTYVVSADPAGTDGWVSIGYTTDAAITADAWPYGDEGANTGLGYLRSVGVRPVVSEGWSAWNHYWGGDTSREGTLTVDLDVSTSEYRRALETIWGFDSLIGFGTGEPLGVIDFGSRPVAGWDNEWTPEEDPEPVDLSCLGPMLPVDPVPPVMPPASWRSRLQVDPYRQAFEAMGRRRSRRPGR